MISQEVLLHSNYSVLRNFLSTTRFFHKIHFYEQRQAEIGKRIKQAKKHPQAALSLLENDLLSSSTLSFKNNKKYSKKYKKASISV